MVTLGELLDGAGHQKEQAMIRSLEFSAPLLHSPERRETGNGVYVCSCLHDEVSIKIPIVQRVESLQADEHMEVLGEWCTLGKEAPHPFPHTWPYISLPSECYSVSFIIFFYSNLVSSKCS